MSNNLFYQDFKMKNIPITKKYNQNNNIKEKNRKIKQNKNLKSPNLYSFNKNRNYPVHNEIINNSKNYNNNSKVNNIKNITQNKLLSKNNNKFISISEFPNSIEDNMYDNLNYINIIQSCIIDNPDSNPKKIKTVDANKYLNNENNSIKTFQDFKLKLLNDNNKFNSPFIFYRNNIDLSNSKKVENEKNYQIKRYRYLTTYRYSFNPIVRRKNSKIIQQWWRNKINPKIDKRKKIIKIQKFFRGYITRKTLNDIICISVLYQNFINKLRHALGNYVHRNYFPKRYYKKKYALEKIFPLKLKLFFRRWKEIKNKYLCRDKAAKFLFKSRNKNRYILLVLKTFFNIWKLKCEQFQKNENKDLSILNQKQKFAVLTKLFNNLEKAGKKNGYNLSKEKIYKYLKNLFQNKYSKKLMELYHNYKIKNILKKYFDLWRKQTSKKNEKNIKLKIITNEIKTQIRKNDKEFLRNYLNILRSKTNLQNINNLKRIKKEFLFPEGGKHIIKCIRKYIIRLIIKEYIRKMKIEKKLLKIIQKILLKYYLNKWNKRAKELSYKNKCLYNLIRIVSKKGNLTRNILTKYFNRWKNKVFINIFKEKKLIIYNQFCNILKKFITNSNKAIVNYKQTFLRAILNSNYKVLLKNRMISKKYNFKFKKSIKPNYRYIKENNDEKNEETKNLEDKKVNPNPRPSRYKIPKFLLNKRKSIDVDDKKEIKNIVVSNSFNIKKDKFYNERLMPYLVNYLNELRLNRLRLVFKYFNYIKKNNLFCLLLKSWTKKQNYIFKQQLIRALKQSNYKRKLFLFMRKTIIHKLAKKYLVIINRRNSLFILVHKMKIFKRINQKRKIRKYLRLWRVFVKLLKDRAAQMERFEKSFNQTYEKLSDSIFVDIGDEKSVQTQVMSFLDKINLDEKKKLKNSLGVSLSSLNSYLSGKTYKFNDLMSGNNNYTFQNDNESNISFSNICNYKFENDTKSLNNSNSGIRNIKSSVFSSINKKKSI